MWREEWNVDDCECLIHGFSQEIWIRVFCNTGRNFSTFDSFQLGDLFLIQDLCQLIFTQTEVLDMEMFTNDAEPYVEINS